MCVGAMRGMVHCRQQGVLEKWDKMRSTSSNGNESLLDDLEHKVNSCRTRPFCWI